MALGCLVHTKVYYLFAKEFTLVTDLKKGEVCETLVQVPLYKMMIKTEKTTIEKISTLTYHTMFITEENQINNLRIFITYLSASNCLSFLSRLYYYTVTISVCTLLKILQQLIYYKPLSNHQSSFDQYH